MKITIVGIGYVGLSLSLVLSKRHEVIAYDINEKKIESLNKRNFTNNNNEIIKFLSNNKLNLIATSNKKKAFSNSEYIIISTPTNFDIKTGSFNTSTIESVITDAIKYNKNASIVIKSTIPLGYVSKIRKNFKKDEIIYSPEFLREDKSLYDNLYPSRIVVGDISEKAKIFAKILTECSALPSKKIPIHYMNSEEAEAVKLFSNTYLAMRIAFFNELDTYAETNELSSKKIIEATSGDPRIGNYYNNPSFGYGGYCLPKDTKELLNNYKYIPNNIIKAIIDSNYTRKKFIADNIVKKSPKSVGIYRLNMKLGSDNFRESAILDIIELLKKKNIRIYLYEPLIEKCHITEVQLNNKLDEFISTSEIIIANRLSEDLKYVKNKVYTRDLFQEN